MIRIINVKLRVHQAYISGGNEAAYAAYRAIMGVGVQESHRVVKVWVKGWGK